MSKITPLFLLVMLFAVLLYLPACGNQGELYRESDAAAIKELEEAAEKLKKSKKELGQSTTQDSAAPAVPDTGN